MSHRQIENKSKHKIYTYRIFYAAAVLLGKGRITSTSKDDDDVILLLIINNYQPPSKSSFSKLLISIKVPSSEERVRWLTADFKSTKFQKRKCLLMKMKMNKKCNAKVAVYVFSPSLSLTATEIFFLVIYKIRRLRLVMERTNERRTTESHQTNFTLMNCIAYSVSGALCVFLIPFSLLPTPFGKLQTKL